MIINVGLIVGAFANHNLFRRVPKSRLRHAAREKPVRHVIGRHEGRIGVVRRVGRRRAAKNLRGFDVGLHRIEPLIANAFVLHRIFFVVILQVLHHAESDLLEIRLATAAPRVFPRARKNRKQNRGENCDNGDDHQKFD